MPGCKKKGRPVIHHTDEDKRIANRLKSQQARAKKSGIALIGPSCSQTQAHRDSQSCIMAGSTTAPLALVEFQEDALMAVEGEHNGFNHSVIDPALQGHMTARIAPPHPPWDESSGAHSVMFRELIIEGHSLEGNITRILHEAACLQMNMPGHIYRVARHRSIIVHQGLDQIAVHITLAEQSVIHGRKLLSVAQEIASQASERPGSAFEVIQMHGCICTIKYTLEILEEELGYL